MNRSLRRPDRTQYLNVLALLLQEHDQAGDDCERGRKHDQGTDQEHHISLDLERHVEERLSYTSAKSIMKIRPLEQPPAQPFDCR